MALRVSAPVYTVRPARLAVHVSPERTTVASWAPPPQDDADDGTGTAAADTLAATGALALLDGTADAVDASPEADGVAGGTGTRPLPPGEGVYGSSPATALTVAATRGTRPTPATTRTAPARTASTPADN
ncbi:hypothetical protein Acsp01_67830 [Actinoplanes sp. NBRC 101535]|nr:hypothetical protein Acsp01_67830 [Actinoplanes sp. NBRC 101535]